MILHPPSITIANGQARVSSKITDQNGDRELWFEVQEEFKDALPTETMDAFVIGCLLPAMITGQDMTVLGPMSSKLNYNLNRLLPKVLNEFMPQTRIVRVTADRLQTSYDGRAQGAITGFSGGVDSFCNYYDHSGDQAPPEFRITHFVYNNIGSHGQKGVDKDKLIFDMHSASVKKFADQEGIPMITVNSNLNEIIGLDFELTATLRNAIVGLLFQKVASKYYYSSGAPIRYAEVRPWFDMTILDPILLPLLNTERMDCILSGGQFDRTEKSLRVAELPASWRFLDVCVDPHAAAASRKMNCSTCWKCMRTQFSFDIAGKLHLYSEVFDLEAYQRAKPLFIVDVISSTNIFQEDLAVFMRKMNYPVSWRIKLAAAITPRYVSERIARRVIPVLLKHSVLLNLVNGLLGNPTPARQKAAASSSLMSREKTVQGFTSL